MTMRLRSKRVMVDGHLEPVPATIHVRDGKTEKIDLAHHDVAEVDAEDMHDFGDLLIMPGVVDAHVHINEPGRTDWEGFATATAAAAVGGCTTIVDMPLNSIPPTTTVDNLHIKQSAAKGQLMVDVGLYGGVIPGNHMEIKNMIAQGARGFKCFMIESGVEEFPFVTEPEIRAALKELQGSSSFLMFHAEMDSCNCMYSHASKSQSQYQTFLDSRPKQLENDAIKLVIELCEEFRVPCHIVHLASADALPMIREAQSRGVLITAETTFHYLFFASEEIPDGHTEYKCCPPIRDRVNRELLWKGLMNGTISYVISDHSPCTPDLKLQEEGDFIGAWGGIASVQYGISIIWTAGSERGMTFSQLTNWICTATAEKIGCESTKGRIKVGHDADFVVWSPEEIYEVRAKDIKFKNRVTPYVGVKLKGVVKRTILRGNVIYDSTKGLTDVMHGQLI